MQKIDLFPTPIGIFDVENYQEINEEILSLKNKEQYQFSSDFDIWSFSNENEGLKKLQMKFLEASAELANEIVDENYKWIDFKNLRGWINLQLPGKVGRVHEHGSVSFAGTYYIDVNEDSGTLNLADPRIGISSWLQLPKKFNSLKDNTYKFKPEIGKLILIPGWLLHNIDLNNSDKVRISVSTNIITKYK